MKVAAEDVVKKGDGYVLLADESVKLNARAHKMSKSRGNVVNPDDIVNEFGADSLRLYEMFMVGRCRLSVSNPVLKAPMVSALETRIS